MSSPAEALQTLVREADDAGGAGMPLPQPTLAAAPAGQLRTVRQLFAPDAPAEWLEQLRDLGFVPGERVAVLRRGFPGGDPLVVRVGASTYALRRAEAACVQLEAATAAMAAR
jgi:ferrous iron transport protein A